MSPVIIRQAKTTSCLYQEEEGGLIVQRALDGVGQSLEDAQENLKCYSEFVQRPQLLLVDIRLVGEVSTEARRLYASHEGTKNCAAIAILTGSAISRIIGNLYLRFASPTPPQKLFTDESEARLWLQSFSQEIKTQRNGTHS